MNSEKRTGFLTLSGYFCLSFLAVGSLLAVFALFWIPAPALKPPYRVGFTLTATLAIAAALAWLGKRLEETLVKPFLRFQAAAILVVIAALGIAEAGYRGSLPPFPARLLHGTASGAPAEKLHALHPIAVGVNPWGQRDETRALIPAAEKPRAAVLGGGFLEDSSKVPVSLLIEEKTAGEFVNLGVRGSTPRELYWRAKRVALALGARKLVLFFDPVEDFLAPQASETRLLPHLASLVVDRPPKASLFGELFPSLAHRLLPIPLLQPDQGFAARLAEGTPENLASILASLAPVNKRDELAARLGKRDLKNLSQWLARPDLGFVQASFVKRLLVSAVGEELPPISTVSRETTAKWIGATLRLAKRNAVDTTLVLIPPAELVDERLREIWAPIGDVRRQAARYGDGLDFMKETFSAKTDVVDLRTVLAGTRGTYLDADGHWSRAGTELVASKLAENFSKTAPNPGAL